MRHNAPSPEWIGDGHGERAMAIEHGRRNAASLLREFEKLRIEYGPGIAPRP